MQPKSVWLLGCVSFFVRVITKTLVPCFPPIDFSCFCFPVLVTKNTKFSLFLLCNTERFLSVVFSAFFCTKGKLSAHFSSFRPHTAPREQVGIFVGEKQRISEDFREIRKKIAYFLNKIASHSVSFGLFTDNFDFFRIFLSKPLDKCVNIQYIYCCFVRDT